MKASYSRIIQTIGVLVVVVAILLETWHHAEPYLIFATSGSLIFAIGTKVVYFSRRRK